jgi:putative acetyltransferase
MVDVQLEYVAIEQKRVVAHALFSRVIMENGTSAGVRAAALGPVAVMPEGQGIGIGSRLIRESIEACRNDGIEAIVVLGHTTYYPRFGFSSDAAKALESPYAAMGDAFMALELVPGALKGATKVAYPPAFSAEGL